MAGSEPNRPSPEPAGHVKAALPLLTAERVVAGSALTATFSVTLTADDVSFLDQPGPDMFLEIDIR